MVFSLESGQICADTLGNSRGVSGRRYAIHPTTLHPSRNHAIFSVDSEGPKPPREHRLVSTTIHEKFNIIE
jgi:hypothetical protein